VHGSSGCSNQDPNKKKPRGKEQGRNGDSKHETKKGLVLKGVTGKRKGTCAKKPPRAGKKKKGKKGGEKG